MREPTDDDRDQDRRDRAEAWTEARRRFEDGDGTITVPVEWSFHTNETAVLRRAILTFAAGETFG